MKKTEAIEIHRTPERMFGVCLGTLLLAASTPASASGGGILGYLWLQLGLFLVAVCIIHLALPKGSKLAAAAGFAVAWVTCQLVTADWPFDANRVEILLITTGLPVLGMALGTLASRMFKQAKHSAPPIANHIEPEHTEDR